MLVLPLVRLRTCPDSDRAGIYATFGQHRSWVPSSHRHRIDVLVAWVRIRGVVGGEVLFLMVIFTLVLLGWGSMVSKNRCVTGAVQPLPIPRGVYAIADALHLFWILGADVLILGWSGSHCTPHAIRIGQLWGAYSFLCLAILLILQHLGTQLPSVLTIQPTSRIKLTTSSPVCAGLDVDAQLAAPKHRNHANSCPHRTE